MAASECDDPDTCYGRATIIIHVIGPITVITEIFVRRYYRGRR